MRVITPKSYSSIITANFNLRYPGHSRTHARMRMHVHAQKGGEKEEKERGDQKPMPLRTGVATTFALVLRAAASGPLAQGVEAGLLSWDLRWVEGETRGMVRAANGRAERDPV